MCQRMRQIWQFGHSPGALPRPSWFPMMDRPPSWPCDARDHQKAVNPTTSVSLAEESEQQDNNNFCSGMISRVFDSKGWKQKKKKKRKKQKGLMWYLRCGKELKPSQGVSRVWPLHLRSRDAPFTSIHPNQNASPVDQRMQSICI